LGGLNKVNLRKIDGEEMSWISVKFSGLITREIVNMFRVGEE
jgi:hypothetical protein